MGGHFIERGLDGLESNWQIDSSIQIPVSETHSAADTGVGSIEREIIEHGWRRTGDFVAVLLRVAQKGVVQNVRAFKVQHSMAPKIQNRKRVLSKTEASAIEKLKRRLMEGIQVITGEGVLSGSGHLSVRIPGSETFLINPR